MHCRGCRCLSSRSPGTGPNKPDVTFNLGVVTIEPIWCPYQDCNHGLLTKQRLDDHIKRHEAGFKDDHDISKLSFYRVPINCGPPEETQFHYFAIKEEPVDSIKENSSEITDLAILNELNNIPSDTSQASPDSGIGGNNSDVDQVMIDCSNNDAVNVPNLHENQYLAPIKCEFTEDLEFPSLGLNSLDDDITILFEDLSSQVENLRDKYETDTFGDLLGTETKYSSLMSGDPNIIIPTIKKEPNMDPSSEDIKINPSLDVPEFPNSTTQNQIEIPTLSLATPIEENKEPQGMMCIPVSASNAVNTNPSTYTLTLQEAEMTEFDIDEFMNQLQNEQEQKGNKKTEANNDNECVIVELAGDPQLPKLYHQHVDKVRNSIRLFDNTEKLRAGKVGFKELLAGYPRSSPRRRARSPKINLKRLLETAPTVEKAVEKASKNLKTARYLSVAQNGQTKSATVHPPILKVEHHYPALSDVIFGSIDAWPSIASTIKQEPHPPPPVALYDLTETEEPKKSSSGPITRKRTKPSAPNQPTNCSEAGSGMKYYSYEYITQKGLKERDTSLITNPDKPYPCPVPECPKAYKNPNGLKYHAKYAHSPIQAFNCVKCDKVYKTNHGLMAHIKANCGPTSRIRSKAARITKEHF